MLQGNNIALYFGRLTAIESQRKEDHFESKRGYIPRRLSRNKLSEAGANTPLQAAGKFIRKEELLL